MPWNRGQLGIAEVGTCSPESLSKLSRGWSFDLVVFSKAAKRRDGRGEQRHEEPVGLWH